MHPLSASQSVAVDPPRKPRPWFTPVAPPPDTIPVEIQRLTRERIHRAVGARMGRADWLAAALVADIGYEYDTTEFGRPFRRRPYLVIATTYWRDRFTKTRFDLAIVPCSDSELAYYAEPVSVEIAKYAFQKYGKLATYRVVLASKGAFIDTHAKWGQQ